MKLFVKFSLLFLIAQISATEDDYEVPVPVDEYAPPTEPPCEPECPENEVFTKCGNHGCLNTCAEPEKITYCDPAPGCFPGCICKEDYLRNSKGVCVPKCDCVPTCGENEEWSETGAHGCQNTCAKPTWSHVCRPIPKAGCICKEGYLKNSKGKCVRPEKCDCCKKPYEIFSLCDNHSCQNTCEEPDLITRCTYEAGCYPGCICRKGYLRNAAGDCVPEKKCPPCGPFEKYDSCGTACPITCDNRLERIICNKKCVSGCFCIDGYVRDKNNKCIPETSCPNYCGKNEMYTDCGTACPKTCDNKDEIIICTLQCVPGCFCLDGYVRNKNNQCILPKYCPPKPTTCKPTPKPTTCKPTTCKPPTPKPTTCKAPTPKPTTCKAPTPKPTTCKPPTPKPTTCKPPAPKPIDCKPPVPKPIDCKPPRPLPCF